MVTWFDPVLDPPPLLEDVLIGRDMKDGEAPVTFMAYMARNGSWHITAGHEGRDEIPHAQVMLWTYPPMLPPECIERRKAIHHPAIAA